MKSVVVVGGGISGLYAALLLKGNNPGKRVVLIESESQCGGLLRSFDYGSAGKFDYGIHTLYETGVDRIDSALQGILPESEWNYLVGREKDLGASWLDGRIQYDTSYPSISNRPDFDELVADFLRSFGLNEHIAVRSAYDDSLRLFGQKITDRIVAPAVEARQHMAASLVHPLSLKVQGLDRIAGLPLETVVRLAQIKGFDGRFAFPDQRKSPINLISGRRAFYPTAGHMSYFTERLVQRVKASGVEIMNDAQIVDIQREKDCITMVHGKQGDTLFAISLDRIFWCAGIPPLGRLMKMPMGIAAPPNATVIVNMLVDRAPRTNGVFYIYFHGHERCNRVSFLQNYSGHVRADGLHPVCVEMGYPAGSDTADAAEIAETACRAAGIIPSDCKISFSRVERLRQGYPSFGIDNIENVKNTRDRIGALAISNLEVLGPLARDDLFFQFDVLKHVDETIAND